MIIPMNEMYLGETAEIMSLDEQIIGIRRLRDMGLREGKLIDLLHYDPLANRKIIIGVDNARIAFDAELAGHIKVRPLKSYYEVVEAQANYDRLTGCLNRHSIECILTREYEKFLSNKIPLSILLADIDYFKRINDTYGHGAGDGVLKNISALFKQLLRRSDCLCRWGGEEFLILLRGTLMNEALQIAERLRESVESHIFQPFKGSGFVTVSMGVCGLPPDRRIEHLLEMADTALYEAKKSGRNRVNSCEVAI
ncbi:GGDEF domain-containing protein [Dissulfurispira sp.]|uniref:GGDEF domain-containing protein n=1 Tax=Dissulfurispira sp. TaxID=2817609 RepID=UPI002FD92027